MKNGMSGSARWEYSAARTPSPSVGGPLYRRHVHAPGAPMQQHRQVEWAQLVGARQRVEFQRARGRGQRQQRLRRWQFHSRGRGSGQPHRQMGRSQLVRPGQLASMVKSVPSP